MQEISATNFKARCLALLDDVADTGAELIVTKRGNPVARVTAFETDASLNGTVTQLVTDDELMAPIDNGWKVDDPRS